MTVRVVVADDQAVVRAGLRTVLAAAPDIDVVGEAGDGAEAAELAETLRATHGVLVVPGVHFGLEHHLRIGIGGNAGLLREGLARLGRVLAND